MTAYRRWHCKDCRKQFTVTSQTIFHRSKIDLPRWFVAIWLMCHSPKGVSAKQLERELGVCYETAWYMAKRIRKAMKHEVFTDKLCGIVEVDDAVIRTTKGGGPGATNEKVVGMAQRGGALKMIAVQDLKAFRIERIAMKNIDAVRAIYTDAARQYRHFCLTMRHEYVTHAREWAREEVHTNTIESAWSLFKRGVIGVFHHVSQRYLQDYLDEFAFRYSHRKDRERMFDLVLANC
jgi:transposase-like protein